jgi:hypothetical protein
MKLDWTTIACSGLTAAIVGSFTLFSNRYLSKLLDHIEKRIANVTGTGIKPKDGK